MTTPKPVVLHVEDDDASAYLFRIYLRRQHADVDVFRLCNGADATLFLTRSGVFADAPRPSVVVLDLDLPKKNGHEILSEIRQDAALKDIPVIIFSSSVRPHDRDRAFSLGVNHFIQKSSDLDVFGALAQRVQEYLPAPTEVPKPPPQE